MSLKTSLSTNPSCSSSILTDDEEIDSTSERLMSFSNHHNDYQNEQQYIQKMIKKYSILGKTIVFIDIEKESLDSREYDIAFYYTIQHMFKHQTTISCIDLEGFNFKNMQQIYQFYGILKNIFNENAVKNSETDMIKLSMKNFNFSLCFCDLEKRFSSKQSSVHPGSYFFFFLNYAIQ